MRFKGILKRIDSAKELAFEAINDLNSLLYTSIKNYVQNHDIPQKFISSRTYPKVPTDINSPEIKNNCSSADSLPLKEEPLYTVEPTNLSVYEPIPPDVYQTQNKQDRAQVQLNNADSTAWFDELSGVKLGLSLWSSAVNLTASTIHCVSKTTRNFTSSNNSTTTITATTKIEKEKTEIETLAAQALIETESSTEKESPRTETTHSEPESEASTTLKQSTTEPASSSTVTEQTTPTTAPIESCTEAELTHYKIPPRHPYFDIHPLMENGGVRDLSFIFIL
jgi:hypothetical protein